MPLRPRPRRWLATALVAALVAAGCSDNDDDAADAPRDDTEAEAAVGEPVDGGTLFVGLDRPRSLDPLDASPDKRSELIVADLLFDGLTRYDPETGEAVGSLATRFKPLRDMRTWLFRLRPDAKFANGRTVGAADVKYSIERVAKKGSRSPAAAQLELVVGYNTFTDGKADNITGMRVVEPDLLEVRLITPLSTFPLLMASPLFGVVPKEAVEAESPSFAQAPVGSGSFEIEGREGNVVHLVKSAGSPALLDGIDLVFFDDVEASYDAFVEGRVDWSRVPSSRVDEAAERYGTAGFEPFHAEVFYGFNVAHKQLKDVRFREAIVRAIDREAIVRAIYTDTVGLLDGIVVDGIEGRANDPCGDKCTHDPVKAKALVKAVFKAKKPPVIGIDYDEGTVQEAIAKAIAADLKEVGIPSKLRAKPFSEYQEFAASGDQQLFRLGWIAVYRSADAFLAPLFLTRSPDNVTGFSDKAVDTKLKAARAEADPAKRRKLYAEAETSIMAKLPIVPIAQFQTHTVSSSRVHDLDVALDGTFDATRVWVTGTS